MARQQAGRATKRNAVALGDLLSGALRDLGMPSRRLGQRVREAWQRAADPTWVDDARPVRLEGGVLVVGVGSSSLRQELTQFHRDRLLAVLRAALPGTPLVALRFVADVPSATSGDTDTGELR